MASSHVPCKISLPPEQLAIYQRKIDEIGFDPYGIDKKFFSISKISDWPKIEYPDLYNYLVLTSSTYNQDQMKAYKSLQAYNYFVAGWVGDINVGKITSDIYLIMSKVRKLRKFHFDFM